MNRSRVLVVDDEVGMLEVCRDTLSRLPDVDVELESDPHRAVRRLREERWDVLIADIRMPGLSGVELTERAREFDAGITTMLITAFPSIETAVEALKLGASDYIIKPFLPEALLRAVSRLLEVRRLSEEHRLLSRHIERPFSSSQIIGRTEVMRAVFNAIDQIAETNDDVLITGETGTGKELVARSIHDRSRRAGERFVPVDCGAIPDDLLESEFFGHERGAFTGATARSLGLLEFAHKGTFFLDEVSELPLRLQAKLLRTLQERRVRRLGAKDEIDVDVRVIAATNRDLEAEVQGRQFRADLYFRINVLRISLPPLRERTCDLPVLVEHFVDRYARERGKEGMEVDPEVIEVFAGYPWPGNVRELQNVLKRAMAVCSDQVLRLDDVPDDIVARAGSRPNGTRPGFFDLREQQICRFELDYLRGILEKCEGDVAQAAVEAHIPRGTMYRLINKHELAPATFR